MSGNHDLYECKYCQESFWDYEEHDCPQRNEPTYQELKQENESLKNMWKELSGYLDRVDGLKGLTVKDIKKRMRDLGK